MKRCKRCGKDLKPEGKYYHLGIGSTCYKKYYLNTGRSKSPNYKKYSNVDKEKGVYDLPLFEVLKDGNKD